MEVMFTIINVTEDNGNLKSVPIRGLKEALKAQTVDKIWTVAPGHVFYIIRGDDCLHTCSLYQTLPSNVKQGCVPLKSPLINLICAGCGYVILVAEDCIVQVLKHSPEEGWLPAGHVSLPDGDPIIHASLCQNRHFFWARQERGAHPVVSCTLWRCILSPEDCSISSVCCLAVRLPALHSLYTFATSVAVFPSVPDMTAIFWMFTEANTFSLLPVSRPTQHLYSSTFELPLDASSQYKRHLRLWRLQDQTAHILDILPSHLGTSLYIFVWDGTLTLSILGQHLQTLQLETQLEWPVACFTFGPVIVLVREKELTIYDMKTGKQMPHREAVPGKLCKVLPVVGGFCTDTGIHRLHLHEDTKDDRLPSVLQSQALQLCFSLSGCDVDKVSAVVRTKLHRILQPLVDCYQKLQEARDALVSRET